MPAVRKLQHKGLPIGISSAEPHVGQRALWHEHRQLRTVQIVLRFLGADGTAGHQTSTAEPAKRQGTVLQFHPG